MNKLYIVLLLFILAGNHQLLSQKKRKISIPQTILVIGSITKNTKWCGGARPSPELEAELATPKPYAELKLYIKRKSSKPLEQPIIDSVVTDSDGKFKIKLPIGSYSVVDSNRRDVYAYRRAAHAIMSDTNNYRNLDIQCLEKHYNQVDFNIDVKRRASPIKVSHNYFIKCGYRKYPCAEYIGALPN